MNELPVTKSGVLDAINTPRRAVQEHDGIGSDYFGTFNNLEYITTVSIQKKKKPVAHHRLF